MNKILCRALFVLYIVFWGSVAMAQNKEADSLKTVLKTAKGKNRADALNALAGHTYYDDPAGAEKLVAEASEMSNKLDYVKGKIEVDVNRARLLYGKKDFAGAIALINKTMPKARQEKLFDDQSFLYRNGIASYRDWNKYKKSLEVADEYLAFAREQNLDKYLAYAYKEKATTCYYMGNLECALDGFERSMVAFEHMNNFSAASGMGMNLGIILYRSGRAKESLKYYDRAVAAFEKLKDTANIANALLNKALSHEMLGEGKEAVKIYHRSAGLYRMLKDEKGYANTMEIIGNHYNNTGDFASSLKYLLMALKSREKQKDQRGIALSYVNIGTMYAASRDTAKAIDYTLKARAINKEIGNEYSYSTNLMTLGGYYNHAKKYTEASALLWESISIKKRLGDFPGLASSYINMGNVHLVQNNLDSAQAYYLMALKVNETSENAASLAGVYANLGKVYMTKGKPAEAIGYLLKAEAMQQKIGDRFGLSGTHQALSETYAGTGEYKKAYDYYNLFHKATDSMFNVNMSQSMAEMRTKYEVEKKQKENEILRQKSKLDKAELQSKEEARKKQRVIIYAVLGVAVLCVLLLLVVARTSAQRRKTNQRLEEQNEEITLQKHVIEEKNKDITDSINYAKRIQEAILPPDHVVKNLLRDAFVLYKPKDIVSGDFYWVQQSGHKVLFAAVDCTGHGVPGAFVSIVGHNALNRAVKEYNLSKPGEILDKLNELVEETFDAHGSNLKDGMDISLCCIDFDNNTLEWSGANNPLWIVHHDGTFTELKADKQPIGKYEGRKPFTLHQLQLKKDDIVYVFSDGYADQFGGPAGKKFKYSQLKDSLLAMRNLPMKKQRDDLAETVEKWRGPLEQIDDICILGVKL